MRKMYVSMTKGAWICSPTAARSSTIKIMIATNTYVGTFWCDLLSGITGSCSITVDEASAAEYFEVHSGCCIGVVYESNLVFEGVNDSTNPGVKSE